ncbi:histidine phosphatase family protein [Enterococcus sp. HY326]|uniref:histidine phosphatase family protein n=1 Tax=Enterococcus sp. HY326 TaxID=2971265 RepID=UPI00223EFC71|nr:histidine phosphatase family protein [Enterococcus sp. HY326]
MDLYFTRHGKTEWNLAGRFQGMMGDSPLLPTSHDEIKQFGQHVKEIPFAKVYASTSKRAQDTAKGIVSQLAQPVEIISTPDLRELGLGTLEGRSIESRRKHFAETLDNMRYRMDLYDPTPFEGEPIDQAIARVVNVVTQAVADNTTDQPLLFVGHGASLTSSIQWLAGKSLAEVRSQGGLLNSSLTILEAVEPKRELPYQLKLWNDVSFLTE